MRFLTPSALVVLALGLWAGPGGAAAPEEKDASPSPPAPAPVSVYPPGPDPVWDNVVAGQRAYDAKLAAQPLPAPPALPLHLYVDGGVYLLQPFSQNNPAFLGARRVGRALLPVAPKLTYDTEFSPHVVLGVVTDCGWGVRTSWWDFAEGSDLLGIRNTDPTGNTLVGSVPVSGLPGFVSPGSVARAFGVFNDTMAFQTKLDMQVWDTEVTRSFNGYGWDLLFSGGIRFAYLSQSYLALRANGGRGTSGTSRVTVTLDQDIVSTGHNFNGVGPTAAVAFRRALGDSGFALYGLGRTSLECGRGRTSSYQATVENRTVTPVRGSATTTRTTTVENPINGHDDVLPVEDLEVGVEWSRAVGPARLFLQTGLVFQEWFYAGSGSSDRGNLSFLGLSLTAGVAF